MMTAQTLRERMVDVVARELMRPEHCCDGTEKDCRDSCPRPAIEVFNADDLAETIIAALAEAGLVGDVGDVIELLGKRLDLLRGHSPADSEWCRGFGDGWNSARLQINDTILNPRVAEYVRSQP